jgi:hypothetical protein
MQIKMDPIKQNSEEYFRLGDITRGAEQIRLQKEQFSLTNTVMN